MMNIIIGIKRKQNTKFSREKEKRIFDLKLVEQILMK